MTQTKTINPAAKTFFALGTANTIRVYDADKEAVVEAAAERVFQLDDMLSAFKPESDISAISRNADSGFQPVSRDTYMLIKKAAEFGKASGGVFDITIHPLTELWGINKKGDFVPPEQEIRSALSLVNYKDIRFNVMTNGVALKKPGQSLDLGGIAKGYAADEVRRILTENGVKSAMVNLGGNIVAIGKRPDGNKWQIGIQNPLASTGEYSGVLTVEDKTIVTSGCNERFFIKDGVRYHHIIDPRTGKPAQSDLLSVTAVCLNSTQADALTTALFILGPVKGMRLLKKYKAEAIFINRDLTVTVTPGLSKDYEPKQ